MSLFDLTGKVAIVTGATSGIGLATARRLAEHGASVVVSARTQTDCDRVAAELEERHGPGRALGIAADLTRLETLNALVDRTAAEYGGLDILICNARHPCPGALEDLEPEAFSDGFDTNVRNTTMMVKRAAPSMAARGGGSVILVASTAGITPMADLLVYGAAKIALRHIAATLAVHLGPSNIRVNAIAPGSINTDTTKAMMDNPAATRALTRDFPLARVGEPDEIAAAAVFLCSPGGAYVTGQTLVIDGGQVLTAGQSVRAMKAVLTGAAG